MARIAARSSNGTDITITNPIPETVTTAYSGLDQRTSATCPPSSSSVSESQLLSDGKLTIRAQRRILLTS
ncbi:hypothetical protein KFK09_001352 [Dendrobium nobile]|uniref:Uncharacterized protein n=1 Tax=Dendrobium nobile TaxID=94219 RepID=A0A8T3C9C5_DENNO|nr:hypothetical protein KFK09_001352 [Dendrobium nobile]